MAICAFSFIASTQCFQYDLSQMFGVIVLARNKCVQTACQAIDWRFVGGIIFIRKDYVESSIQLLCGKVSEVFADEGEGDEIYRGGLGRLNC